MSEQQQIRSVDAHDAIGTIDGALDSKSRPSLAPKPKRSSVATALRLMAPSGGDDDAACASPLARRMSTRVAEATQLLRDLPPLEPERRHVHVSSTGSLPTIPSADGTSQSSKASVFEVGARSEEDGLGAEEDEGEEGEAGVSPGSETIGLESEAYETQIEAAIAAAQPLPPSIREWAFDVWAVPENTMPGAMMALLHSQDAILPLKVPVKPLLRLLASIRDRYWRRNAFHNAWHGLHVAQATTLLLEKTKLGCGVMPDLERFALLLAAFAHDVDHPATGNGYLMSIADELAVTYANESVLENHHAALTLALLAGHTIERDVSTSSEVVAAAVASAREEEGSPKPGLDGGKDSDSHTRTTSSSLASSSAISHSTDVLSHFSPAQQRRIRRVVTAAILATDMSKHATVVIPAVKALDLPAIMAMKNKSQGSASGAGSGSAGGGDDDQEAFEKQMDSIHGILLHCADLTGQVLPWDISSRWSDGVVAEFRAQAALEISAKLTPTPHMHGLHTAKAVAKLQSGFCDFVLAPLWRAMADKFPVLEDRVAQLQANSDRFKAIAKEEEAKEAAAAAAAAGGAGASDATTKA